MRILVTNDDGIHAPGLKVLERIALELSQDVWIVAPETDQSGASHSLTLNNPLRLRQVSERRYAVQGTPTDCVIMGVRHILLEDPPDLVLSGVNRGQNLADDVTYSGTIAGAFEGALLGVRSIALSQAYNFGEGQEIRWETAEAHGPETIRKLLTVMDDPGVVMNVNFPNCDPGDVAGTEVTRQGKRDQNLLYLDGRKDGRGNPYYWLGFARKLSNPPQGSDLRAVYDGRISVTPLALDLTDDGARDRLREAMR
ncbi:MAG: 5'/3'-nucleotidase SurE [Flavobacteriaceae bacterium]